MSIHRRLNRLPEQGFTIVELLTATAITGILVIVVMTFMTNAFVEISIDSARADLLQEAQLSLDAITKDIRLSASADDNNRWQDTYAPSAPSNLLSWHSSSTTLVLATAVLDSNHNVLFDDPLHYVSYKNNVIYFVSNGTLYKRTLAAPVANNASKTSCPSAHTTGACKADRALMHNVSSFSIRYINGEGQDVSPTDARAVEVSVQLAANKFGQAIDANYTTRTVFRNE